MNRLQYFTHDIREGPWLLGAKALRDLDSIILRNWKKLENRRQRILDIIVEDEKHKLERQLELYSPAYLNEQLDMLRRTHPTYSTSYLQIRIYYKKFTSFPESFESALHARELDDVDSEGLAIEFCSGDVKGMIDLNKVDGLYIDVSPEDVQEVQDVYRDVSDWADNNRASYWQRLWGKLADFGYKPYLGMLIILGGIFAFMNLLSANSDVQAAQIAATQLLDQGITTANIPDAVKLLLEIQVLGKRTLDIPSWLRVVLMGTVFLGIVIPVRPKVVLGIGKGIDRLRYWKIWQSLVGITIPALIFYNFILPYIIGLIKLIVDAP